MSAAVTVFRSGGGAVAVDRTAGPAKVVTAGNVGTLLAATIDAAAGAGASAAAAAASAAASASNASAAAASAAASGVAGAAAEAARAAAEAAEAAAAASASAAAAGASAASASAAAASGSAGTAGVSAGAAEASASDAATSASAAAASAAAAAASAASVTLPIPIASGGTGETSAAAALTALGGIAAALLTTRGDIIVRDAAVPARLALGASGRVLQSDGTDALYGTLAAGAFATGPGIVTPAMLANGAALSVLGVGGSAGAARADIAAANDGEVLRRSGTTVAFGTVATAGIANDAVTYAKLQNVSATARLLGRKTASAGDAEECTLSEVLDFIGSAARGDILYRGASGWARLAAGSAGNLLQTGGAAGDPSWAAYPTIVSLEGLSLAAGDILYATAADTLARLAKGTDGQQLELAAGLPSWRWPEETYGFAISDEATAITTGTAKLTVRPWAYAFTVTAVRASLTVASSSGTPTVDINEAGTTILSTKLTIDANERTSTTAATAAVISDPSIAADAEITFDIDTAGTGAKGLKVWITGRRT